MAIKITVQKEAIIHYLTENVSAKSKDIAELLGLKSSRVTVILGEMIDEQIIVAEGANRNRIYRLKS